MKKKAIYKRFEIVLLCYVTIFSSILFLSFLGYKCPFKEYFGIHCIGCGMRGAFFAIIELDFSRALLLNPLIYPIAFFVITFSIYYIFFYRKVEN